MKHHLVLFITVLAVSFLTVAHAKPQKQKQRGPVNNRPGRCPSYKGGLFDGKDFDRVDLDNLEGLYRTVYGSDHFGYQYGFADETHEIYHGCHSISYTRDSTNSTVFYQTTGRPSGFLPFLCHAPKGPKEYGLDSCRRYVYDTKKVVFNNQHKAQTGAIFEVDDENPDGPWQEVYKEVNEKQQEYWYQNDKELNNTMEEMEKIAEEDPDRHWDLKYRTMEKNRAFLNYHKTVAPGPYVTNTEANPIRFLYANQDKETKEFTEVYTYRCVEREVEARLPHEKDDEIDAIYDMANQINSQFHDHKKYSKWLKNQKPYPHYNNENMEVGDKTFEAYTEQFEYFCEHVLPEICEMLPEEAINGRAWLKLRFFLMKQTTFWIHDIDLQLQMKQQHYELVSQNHTAVMDIGQQLKYLKKLTNGQHLFNDTHFQITHDYQCPYGDIHSKDGLEKLAALSLQEVYQYMKEFEEKEQDQKDALLVYRSTQFQKWINDFIADKKAWIEKQEKEYLEEGKRLIKMKEEQKEHEEKEEELKKQLDAAAFQEFKSGGGLGGGLMIEDEEEKAKFEPEQKNEL